MFCSFFERKHSLTFAFLITPILGLTFIVSAWTLNLIWFFLISAPPWTSLKLLLQYHLALSMWTVVCLSELLVGAELW